MKGLIYFAMFFSHFVKTLPALLSFMYIVTGNEQQLGSNTENVTNIVPPDNSHLLDWIPPGNIAQEYPYYLSGYDYNNIPVLVQSQKNMRIALKFFEKLESCYEKIAYGYIVN
ncbi:unnamed protein product, partial [Allacma fusca]